MSFLLEKGVEPLVEALNKLGFVSTVYSCEGHFDRERRELFLPTAYVTFDISDVNAFAGFYTKIRAFNSAAKVAALRLTYDCILGRYTLSVWPDGRFVTPSGKRSTVDATVSQLAHLVREHTLISPGNDIDERCQSDKVYPCSEGVPPCALVIPPKPFFCPFVESPQKELENRR